VTRNSLLPRMRTRSAFSIRGLTSLTVVCVMLSSAPLAPLAAAEKGQSFYKQGTEQEARQNYEMAYEAYLGAFEMEPGNTKYRAAITRTRFLAAASKVHRATLLRQSGRLEESLKLFEAAALIDPSSPIALQEIATTRGMIQTKTTRSPQEQSRHIETVSPDLLDAQGPVKLGPVSNTPITLKMSEDTKVVYETIGKLARLNVLFDPDYTSRRMNIELNGVTLQEALDIVAAESKTFWHPMTPNTIFVAADNPAKRKELEQSVIKTFYLSNLSAPTELQDIVNTLRAVLDVNRVQQLVSQEAIVIRGTPDQVLLAEKVVNDFDTAAPEVVIDIAVMQVSRDKVHKLGLNPPTSASVQLQDNANTSTSSSSSSSSSSSTSSSTTINLNTLANLNATDFTATISAASFNALMSDSATKIIQSPQLRSLNGQKASLKIGDRVPTASGSTQSGIAGVSVSGLNTTQFQYLDVGVNVDVTPHIHADGEVTLKIVLDVSSVTSYVSIGGINEPEIGQRKVEHEIRLKDGEVNLLGGMLEQQETKSLSGIPGFSQIPIMKYFFSEKSTEVKDNEIVFAVIPHIVRKRELSELSRRTLDVGNANSIRLRHAPKAAIADVDIKASDSGAPNAKLPGETPAVLEFNPTAVSVAKGSTFALDVVVSGAQNASSVPLQISYDRQGLQIVNVSNGDFLSQGQQIVALVHREDPSSGIVEITASRPQGSLGVSGHGIVTTLTFQATESGRFPVKITNGAVIQPDKQVVPVSGSEITVSVQ
jgi:general secretion pathway protein D